MFDIEREQLRKTYLLCRLGFTFLAFALVLACFGSLLDLFSRFDRPLAAWIQQTILVRWLDTPMVWACLIGATLLFGRWDHPSWQRRAGLFLVMNLVDLGLWFIARGDAMGLGAGEFGHEWLRGIMAEALGWGEFALISSLTCDYLVHLGVDHARDSDKSTRSMAATGAMVWLLLICQTTDWHAGWPLQPHHQLRGLEGMLLNHGFKLIWAITLIQVTALTISAVRQSTEVIAEMDREDQENDLLQSRSDVPQPAQSGSAYRDKGQQSF